MGQYCLGMAPTTDSAGSPVPPEAMGDIAEVVAGPVSSGGFDERDGLLVIPTQGEPVTDAFVRSVLEDRRP